MRFGTNSKEVNNMRILVLDDSLSRQKAFRERFLEANLGIYADFCSNVEDCISLLSKNNYSIIFLDHDLTEEENQSIENKNTGSEVARWIYNNLSPFEKTRIYIHSLNKIGSKNMLELISNSDHVPFIWDNLDIFKLLYRDESNLRME
jgi:hypothetical protein